MRFLLIPCVFFILIATAHAGELYICIDKSGRETISSLPQDGMKCILKETYRDPSPEERTEREDTEKKIAEELEKNAAKENVNKCIEGVNQLYRQAWDGRCRSMNRYYSCALPDEVVKQLDDQFEEEKNRCLPSNP